MFTRFIRTGFFLVVILGALLAPVSASAQPVLAVNPTAFTLEAYQGDNAVSQTVQVRNAGKRALKWSVVPPSAGWLRVSPGNGTNTGTLTLSFDTSALPLGLHRVWFQVQSNGGSPVMVFVDLQIVSRPSTAPPRLTVSCPANMSATSSNGSPVPVTYSATASGGVAPLTVGGTPASGSVFRSGRRR